MVLHSKPFKIKYKGGIKLFKNKKKKEKIKKQTAINRWLKKRQSKKIAKPKTTSQMMRIFFQNSSWSF